MLDTGTETFQRPPRPEVLQTYVNNSRMWEAVFTHFGGLPYAGNSQNQRPMENESLDDLREKFDLSTARIRDQVPYSLWVVFWNERFEVPLDKGICVAAPRLWLLIEEADLVLLSDGITHHYTSVGHIDRLQGTITFSDNWPDDFFLQSGRNVLGIEAKDCTITVREFESVVVGFLTWHTVDLITSYLNVFEGDAANATAYLRAGYAVMASGEESVGAIASQYFLRAMDIAEAQGDIRAVRHAAARGWLAAQCAIAAFSRQGDIRTLSALEKLAKLATERNTINALWEELTPYELCRLAHNLGQIGYLKEASEAAEVAIRKDPQHEDAFRLRGLALVRIDPVTAVAAAQRALELNTEEIQRLQAEQNRLGKPPATVVSTNTIKLRRAERRRIDGLNLLVAAAFNAGQPRASYDAIVELSKLQPDDALVRRKRLMIERLLGSPDAIREAAIAILSMDAPAEFKAEAQAALNALNS